jgi:hypothetical protein
MMQMQRLILPTRAAVAAVLALAALGCDREPAVVAYKVPVAKPALAGVEQTKAAVKTSILAAIVPHDERVYFFKLMGPEATVAGAKDEFMQALLSVKFTGAGPAEAPLTWNAPTTWTKKPVDPGMRLATYSVGSGDKAAEFTIIPLGKESADTLANINRWRGQVTLPPIKADEINAQSKKVNVDNATAIVVEFTGTSSGAASPPMAGMAMDPMAAKSADAPIRRRSGAANIPMARPPEESSAAPAAPKFAVPPGWKTEANAQFAVATFSAGEGGDAVRITVSPLGSGAADPVINVNRWRGQVGLPPVKLEDLRQMAKPVDMAGDQGIQFDVAGESLRILVTMLPHDRAIWFFRISGPPAAVEKQRANYESFLKSIAFEAGSNG